MAPRAGEVLEQVPVALGGTRAGRSGSPRARRPSPSSAPFATTSETQVSFVKYSVSAFGSPAVAMMSRSRTVSMRRRALPASETRSAAGCSRSDLDDRQQRRAARGRAASPAGRSPSAAERRLEDLLLDLRPERREGPEPPRRAPPPFSSRQPRDPSSCQIFRTVFGPRPGSRRKRTSSAGTVFRFVSAWISPSSTTWTIFSSIVAPIPGAPSPSPPARAGRPGRRSRTRWAARRYARKRKAPRLRSPADRRGGRLLGHVRVARERRRHDRDDTGVKAVVCLPTYDERENLERMVHALGELGRHGARGRRRLARRDRRARRPAGRRARPRRGAPPAAQGGPRPAYLAGFRRALADDAELVLEMDCDFSHDPADVPG